MMKESGDEDIQCSEWKAAEDGVSKCRNIEYTHPVNAPMAPPMARARKEQAYRQYGEHGLVLETKTFVSDVPMTDCFYVADIIRVEPIGDKVSISMHFDIRFVKSTMFKSIISRTTKSEFQNFMKRLANFMAKNLGEEAVIAPFRPQPAPTESPTPSNPYNSTIVPNLTIALLIFIMFLQSWVILDMRSMKREMHVFRETWARDCVAPDVTAEL